METAHSNALDDTLSLATSITRGFITAVDTVTEQLTNRVEQLVASRARLSSPAQLYGGQNDPVFQTVHRERARVVDLVRKRRPDLSAAALLTLTSALEAALALCDEALQKEAMYLFEDRRLEAPKIVAEPEDDFDSGPELKEGDEDMAEESTMEVPGGATRDWLPASKLVSRRERLMGILSVLSVLELVRATVSSALDGL